MAKFKRTRSIRYEEFQKLGKLEQKSTLKTTNAQFRPKNHKNSKKRKKSRSRKSK